VEIQPASIAQVRLGKTGGTITVEDDVGDVARQIKDLDPSLSLHWSPEGEHFIVVEACQDGKNRVMLTTNELDSRVVERLRYISSPDYDYVKDMDRLDDAAKREADHKFHLETGEAAEHMAHALRKDLQYGGKIFLPPWLDI